MRTAPIPSYITQVQPVEGGDGQKKEIQDRTEGLYRIFLKLNCFHFGKLTVLKE